MLVTSTLRANYYLGLAYSHFSHVLEMKIGKL